MARIHYVVAALAALAVLFIAAEAGTLTGSFTLSLSFGLHILPNSL
jgi:hypothetical protein